MKTFCYHCGNVFDVLETDKGRQIHCPGCANTFYADLYDEFKSGAIPGVVPEKKLRFQLGLATAERGCRILATFNGILFCLSFLGFVLAVSWVLVENFWLGLLVALIGCVQLVVIFSLPWALLAISEMLRQIDFMKLQVRR
jgi:hypothetical protein